MTGVGQLLGDKNIGAIAGIDDEKLSIIDTVTMDSKNSSEALSAMDGLGFDDATKKEIQTALVQGQRQAQAHSQLLAFTSMCWDKCITGTPGSRFARGEEACIANCIDRFVDTSEYLLGQVQRQQQLQQAQKSP